MAPVPHPCRVVSVVCLLVSSTAAGTELTPTGVLAPGQVISALRGSKGTLSVANPSGGSAAGSAVTEGITPVVVKKMAGGAVDDAEVWKATMWLAERVSPRLLAPSEAYLRENAALALRARREIPAAGLVPEDLFYSQVLPFRHLDEPVDSWRGLFFEKLKGKAMGATTLKEVVEAVLPAAFGGDLGKRIEFKANSTPEVMAPVTETLVKGYASCTGCSIFIANAFRAVGVPARVVGTPLWNVPEGGNHNWVEVWTGEGGRGGWHFFDAAPADHVDWDTGWFVGDNVKHAEGHGMHGIYAAAYDASQADAEYTLVWRVPSVQLPAEDLTAFYKALP